jgi:hypothetical protein
VKLLLESPIPLAARNSHANTIQHGVLMGVRYRAFGLVQKLPTALEVAAVVSEDCRVESAVKPARLESAGLRELAQRRIGLAPQEVQQGPVRMRQRDPQTSA